MLYGGPSGKNLALPYIQCSLLLAPLLARSICLSLLLAFSLASKGCRKSHPNTAPMLNYCMLPGQHCCGIRTANARADANCTIAQ